jgi:putative hydrolase of the HAD superfamily
VTIERRAIVFDLDDTLYRERRFVLSGFREVARVVAASCDVEYADVFTLLVGCMKRGDRAIALQTMCRALGHSIDAVPELVDIIRGHAPSLRLPASSARTLACLRGSWRLGILTNGFPEVQRRKVAALDVASFVDEIVYACEHGTGGGKPEAAPFLVVAERLGVDPRQCVFVGDDPIRDVCGARAVGMRTIRLDRVAYDRTITSVHDDADAVTKTIESVPRIAAALLDEKEAPAARARRRSEVPCSGTAELERVGVGPRAHQEKSNSQCA